MPPTTPRTRGRPRKYNTPEERTHARRLQVRENQARYQQRKKASQTPSPLIATHNSGSQHFAFQQDDNQDDRSVLVFNKSPNPSPLFATHNSGSQYFPYQPIFDCSPQPSPLIATDNSISQHLAFQRGDDQDNRSVVLFDNSPEFDYSSNREGEDAGNTSDIRSSPGSFSTYTGCLRLRSSPQPESPLSKTKPIPLLYQTNSHLSSVKTVRLPTGNYLTSSPININ